VPSEPLQPGIIPSAAPQTTQATLSPPTPNPIPSAPAPPESLDIPLVPSTPLTAGPRPIPSAPAAPDASLTNKSSRMGTTGSTVMQSTDQGLRPIPPAATQSGDPNGHHEITEPNFSATKPCWGCSPVVEVTATGWLDNPAEEQQGTSIQPILTRVPAGPSNVFISQAQSGGNFVIGDSNTVTPGQTVTVENVPIAIQTTGGTVEIVVGTAIIPLQPPSETTSHTWSHATYAPTPLPPVLTIGTETIAANAQSQYIVAGQSLLPGGGAITVAGSTISLAPSATAIVINGATSSLTPVFGNIWTTAAPALTLGNHVYPANRAGYITISPGTVLKPGAEPITVNGTTLSLDHSGTAVVIQGSTSIMHPVTTVVTLTRSVGSGNIGGANAGYTSSRTWSSPTTKPNVPAKPISAGGTLTPRFVRADGWFGGALVLVWLGLGYLTVGL
jgi:hypothetical protein